MGKIGGCPRPGHCQNKWKSSDGRDPFVDGRGWQNDEMPWPVAPVAPLGGALAPSSFLFGKFSNFDHIGRGQLISLFLSALFFTPQRYAITQPWQIRS